MATSNLTSLPDWGIPFLIGIGQYNAEMIESPARKQQKAKVQMREEIIGTLSKQRIESLRPFVEAANPGDSNDPGTLAFREAEGLKLAFRSVSLLPVSRAR